MKRFILSMRWLLLLAPLSVSAQTAASSFAPDSAVDAVFADFTKPDSPGCALGAYRDDRMIYARGYGLADLERRVPISSRSVFDIGSTSKQFTAAVIVLLAQEGKLSLDDDVRKYIPELPQYERPITIRQMLHHTSGLRDYIGLLILSGQRFDDVTTAEDALRLLTQQRALNFTPGAEHLYSNSGYFLLSQVVERITGRSLRDEMRTRIFEPLGMSASQQLGSYDDVIANRALSYERRAGGYRHDLPRWLQLGDGAVFTTVEDLLRWDRNFFAPTVGGRAMIDTMLVRGRLNDGKDIDYALGLIHGRYRGQAVVSHGGAWGGYRAELLRFPAQHYAVAVLCNLASSDPSTLARRVASVHLASVLEPVVASNASREAPRAAPAASSPSSSSPSLTLTSAQMVAMAGTYRMAGSGATLTMAIINGALRTTEPGSFALRATSPRELVVLGAPVAATIHFDDSPASGSAHQRLRWMVADRPDMVFERVAVARVDAGNVAALAGAYRSGELDGVVWRLRAAGDTLIASYPGGSDMRFRAIAADEFGGGSTTLRFERNAAGAVVGAYLTQGRMRNIRFERLP